MFCSMIPGLNFVTSFLFGWAAVADYYQWNYELFGGPVMPKGGSPVADPPVDGPAA